MISYLLKGCFILGFGLGELENIVFYGFDFFKLVGCFEEVIMVIKLLWVSDGLVDFEGQFFCFDYVWFDIELYEGKLLLIWIGVVGLCMLGIIGCYVDGWWLVGLYMFEDYVVKFKVIFDIGEVVGCDMVGFVLVIIQISLIGDEGEIVEMFEQLLVKLIVLMFIVKDFEQFGYWYLMGFDWCGIMDFDLVKFSCEKIICFCEEVDMQVICDIFLVGMLSQVVWKFKGLVDVGMCVFKVLDYGGMVGVKFVVILVWKVCEIEDEVLWLCGVDV